MKTIGGTKNQSKPNGSFVRNCGSIRLRKHDQALRALHVLRGGIILYLCRAEQGTRPALRASSGETFLCHLGSEVTILFIALVYKHPTRQLRCACERGVWNV